MSDLAASSTPDKGQIHSPDEEEDELVSSEAGESSDAAPADDENLEPPNTAGAALRRAGVPRKHTEDYYLDQINGRRHIAAGVAPTGPMLSAMTDAIGRDLSENKRLKTVELTKSQLTDDMVISLTRSLDRNPTLQKLILGVSQIGDPGCIELAKLFANCPKFDSLTLETDQILPLGITEIVRAAQKAASGRPIKVLKLLCAGQGVGFWDYESFLKTDANIELLDLPKSVLNNAGGVLEPARLTALVDALRHNSATTVRFNGVLAENDFPQIRAAIRSNPLRKVLAATRTLRQRKGRWMKKLSDGLVQEIDASNGALEPWRTFAEDLGNKIFSRDNMARLISESDVDFGPTVDPDTEPETEPEPDHEMTDDEVEADSHDDVRPDEWLPVVPEVDVDNRTSETGSGSVSVLPGHAMSQGALETAKPAAVTHQYLHAPPSTPQGTKRWVPTDDSSVFMAETTKETTNSPAKKPRITADSSSIIYSPPKPIIHDTSSVMIITPAAPHFAIEQPGVNPPDTEDPLLDADILVRAPSERHMTSYATPPAPGAPEEPSTTLKQSNRPWPINLELRRGDVDHQRLLPNVIGNGGFATVYKARCKGKTYALKEFKSMDLMHAGFFENEVKIWGSIRPNPHVVPLFGYCPQSLFLLSEYHAGGTLIDYCKKVNYQVDVCHRGLLHAAHGFEALHDQETIHGDISPKNILVALYQGHPHARICDFGLSQAREIEIHSQGMKSVYHGPQGWTLRYSSPEHVQPHVQVKKPGDVWSFGSVCYEILSRGQQPYGQYSSDLVPLIQRGIHPGSKPQHFLGSEKLWDMIERCWKLKPEDRPTMSEVCGILEKEYENLTEIPV